MSEPNGHRTAVDKVKQAVLDILSILKIDPYSLLPFEQTATLEPFFLDCIAEARRRKYLPHPGGTAPQPFQEKHVRIGALLGHYVWVLPDLVPRKLAVLASLLAGFHFCVDDGCFAQASLGEYGARVVGGLPQLETGLDAMTAVNNELASMYDPVVGDLIRISHQAFVMGNYLEGEMPSGGIPQWKVSKHAPAFPAVMKTITSVATSLYLLSFPPKIPFTAYLQSLPDGVTIHINTADVMSYHKESVDNEFNRVEQIAQLHNTTGSDMLNTLVSDTAASHDRVTHLLFASDPTGHLQLCYEKSIVGFVVFQALHPRYRLRDLGIFSF